MYGRTWALALLLTLLPLGPAVALAQPADADGADDAAADGAAAPTEPSDELTEEARARFDAGRNAYRDGRFDEALVHFERAYEITGDPDLVYNIAAVNDRLRRDEAALSGYRQYLELRPASPDRSHIEARISHLERIVATSAELADRVDASQPRSDEEIRLLRAAAAFSASQSRPDMPDLSAASSEASAPADFGDLPAGLGIVGGVLLVASAGLWAWFFVDRDRITGVAQDTPARDIAEAYGRAPVVSGFAIALLGLGAAALTAGIVLAVLQSGPSRSSAALRLGPGAVALEGRF